MAKSRFSNIDEYGFVRPDNFDPEEYEAYMSDYLTVLVRRGRRWETILGSSKPAEKVKKSFKLRRFVRKGIPSKLRGRVWMAISGAESMRSAGEKGLYFDMLSVKNPNSLVAEQINTDIPRTFPNNVHFASDDPNSLQQPLFNVLLAFANVNPKVGYCQGLNYVAGLLLLVTKDEEQSFWLLRALTENLLPDYYIPDIPGLITDVRVFAELLRDKVPEVYRHVESFKMPWELICSKWFMCLYSDVLPIETVLRIWDCLFYDGSKILLRVAITLVALNKDELLACSDFAELVGKFQRVVLTEKALRCHEFIQMTYKLSDPLKSKDLIKMRNQIGYGVRQELQNHQRKRDLRRNEGKTEPH